MIDEYNNLLLLDLCARLPYGVKVHTNTGPSKLEGVNLCDWLSILIDRNLDWSHGLFKPYLRPLTSMTTEEREEYTAIDNRAYTCPESYAHVPAKDRIDWLNEHHFDYRGLIPLGLALEAPEGMYVIAVSNPE